MILFLIAIVLGTVRIMVARGQIAMPAGGHLAQTYQAAAHGFVFAMGYAWWVHWRWAKVVRRDWHSFERTAISDDGGYATAPRPLPNWLARLTSPDTRFDYMFLFWALTVVEIGCFLYTKFGR
jgi:hypothetical protein